MWVKNSSGHWKQTVTLFPLWSFIHLHLQLGSNSKHPNAVRSFQQNKRKKNHTGCMVKTTSSWYNDAVRGKGYTALTLYFCCPIYSFCSANSFEMAPFIVTSNRAQAVLWADQWIWGSLSASPHQLIYFILIQLGLESCFSLPKVDLASPSHFATHLHPQLLFSHCFSYFVFFWLCLCPPERAF